MSFEAIKWAINQDIDDPKEKLLLVILSDFLNDRTRQCNPSRETLMRKACIKNNKTLSSKLDSLVSKGLIEIVRGKGISNRYLVQNRTTFNSEPSSAVNHVQHCTTTRFSSEPTPSSAVNHEPISEPIKEPNTLSKEREDKNFSLTPTEKKVSKKQTAAKRKEGPLSIFGKRSDPRRVFKNRSGKQHPGSAGAFQKNGSLVPSKWKALQKLESGFYNLVPERSRLPERKRTEETNPSLKTKPIFL